MMNAILGMALSGLLLATSGSSRRPLSALTVVVDPGHGGKDMGAIGQNVEESKLVLEISQRVAQRLRHEGARVVMTRSDRHNILDDTKKLGNRQRANLEARVALAHRVQANLYISIHANKAPGYPSATGGQVFLGRKPMDRSRALAACLQKYVAETTQSRRLVDDRQELYLMEHLKISSVLVEVGFLSNAGETHRMLDPRYQERLAQAISDGVVCYVQQPPAPTPSKGTQPAHRRALVALNRRGSPPHQPNQPGVDTFARAHGL